MRSCLRKRTEVSELIGEARGFPFPTMLPLRVHGERSQCSVCIQMPGNHVQVDLIQEDWASPKMALLASSHGTSMLLVYVLAKVCETGLLWDEFKASDQVMVPSSPTVLHLGELQDQNKQKDHSKHWLQSNAVLRLFPFSSWRHWAHN